MRDLIVGVDFTPGKAHMAITEKIGNVFYVRDLVTINMDLVELISDLEKHKVAPEIIERVRRLNPNFRFGVLPRGIHYKEGRRGVFFAGLIQKGEVLRREGREFWARIPREAWVKRGRRVFVRLHVIDRTKRQSLADG